MCGISAYLGNKNNNKAIDCLLASLKMLQNRGYDSAGICYLKNNNIYNTKYASDKISGIEKLEKSKYQKTNIGIAHTRWATHGPKNDINAHPHLDYTGRFAIVHNGIIENYYQLKQELLSKRINFKSATDTEVIINLFSYYFNLLQNKELALQETVNRLEGTWGLVIIDNEKPNELYVTRKGSPLLLGKTDDYIMITSEISGFCNFVNQYFIIKENDIIICQLNNNNFIDIKKKGNYSFKNLNKKDLETNPGFYQHWTIKEIKEQPQSIIRAINNNARIKNNYEVKLGGLDSLKEQLLEIDNLIILGCGTSLHASLIGKSYFDSLYLFNSVIATDGAEFNETIIPRNGKSALLLLSQSGETKDLHRCIEIGRNKGLIIISIVNVVDSMIAREADCGVYLNAGREVAVASTKCFTSQLIVLSMISVWFSQNKNTYLMNRKQIIADIRNLSNDVNYLIEELEDKVQLLAKDIISSKKKSLFILGKGYCKEIAREGALKIKEIAYLHAEGYSGSALKHGPFALLEKDTPVIFIAPNDSNFSKMVNSAEEVKSRHSKVIFITDKHIDNFENIIKIPINKTFSGLLAGVVLQLLAYHLSIIQDINPDYPKNLAKVVTVE